MHFNPHEYEQTNQFLPIFNKLSDIYADIEGELCSKQSTLFNKLKNKFSDLYSGLLPSHYVVVNHVLSLSNNSLTKTLIGQQISLATENGVLLLVKSTYLGDKIFINGLFDRQLIYEAKGNLIHEQAEPLEIDNNWMNSQSQQQIEQFKKDIQNIIYLANQSLSLNKLYGGTILINSNVSERVQNYKQKILLGIFLTLLIINSQLDQSNYEEVYQRLSNSQMFNVQFLRSQFSPFLKGELLISKNNWNQQMQVDEVMFQSIKLSNQQKLLFFDINLSSLQIQQIKKSRQLVQQKITSKSQSELIALSETLFKNICQLQQNKLSLSKYINLLNHQISDNQKIKSHSTILNQIQQQIQDIALLLHKKPQDFIIQGNYLVCCVKSYQIHQTIRVLRKYINNQINQQNPEIISKRFNSNTIVSKMIFSCSPSVSLAILNPQQQIWFK